METKTNNTRKLRHIKLLKNIINTKRFMDIDMRNDIIDYLDSLDSKYSFLLLHYGEDVSDYQYDKQGRYIGKD